MLPLTPRPSETTTLIFWVIRKRRRQPRTRIGPFVTYAGACFFAALTEEMIPDYRCTVRAEAEDGEK